MMGMLVVKLTLIQRHREKGRVAMTNRMERQVKIQAADPGPCGSAENSFVTGTSSSVEQLGCWLAMMLMATMFFVSDFTQLSMIVIG